jgi:uncharacterized protein YjeT (DUF2065 family)
MRPEEPVFLPRVGLRYQAPLIAFLLDGISPLLAPRVSAQMGTQSHALPLRLLVFSLRL